MYVYGGKIASKNRITTHVTNANAWILAVKCSCLQNIWAYIIFQNMHINKYKYIHNTYMHTYTHTHTYTHVLEECVCTRYKTTNYLTNYWYSSHRTPAFFNRTHNFKCHQKHTISVNVLPDRRDNLGHVHFIAYFIQYNVIINL